MPTNLNKIQVLLDNEQYKIIKEAAKANLRTMGAELAFRALVGASMRRVSAATDSAGRRATPRRKGAAV